MSRLVEIEPLEPQDVDFGANAEFTDHDSIGAYASEVGAEFLESIDYEAANEVLEFNMPRTPTTTRLAVGWRIRFGGASYKVFRVTGTNLPTAGRVKAHGERLA